MAIIKTVNNNLIKENKSLVKKQWAQERYSRRECLEISGILSEVNGDTLESRVGIIFQELGCNISPVNLESVHRIKYRKTIIKFRSRKDVGNPILCWKRKNL